MVRLSLLSRISDGEEPADSGVQNRRWVAIRFETADGVVAPRGQVGWR